MGSDAGWIVGWGREDLTITTKDFAKSSIFFQKNRKHGIYYLNALLKHGRHRCLRALWLSTNQQGSEHRFNVVFAVSNC